jgi:hypothetical protein
MKPSTTSQTASMPQSKCLALRVGVCGTGSALFKIEVFPQEDELEIRGSIEVEVSVSNVSDIEKLSIPIKVLSDFGSALETAQRVLNDIKSLDHIGYRALARKLERLRSE